METERGIIEAHKLPADSKPGEDEADDKDSEDGGITIGKDDEAAMVADDGHIVVPDCLCAICHKYVLQWVLLLSFHWCSS